MISRIYIDSKARKQQQTLLRSGKKAAAAAVQVDRIIERLVSTGRLWDETVGVTKHGELRVKNCVKFDLGSGYRLITLKQSDAVLVLYAGTHDDCNQWLENNREPQLELILNRCEVLTVQNENASSDDLQETPFYDNAFFSLNEEAEDECLENSIAERDLRRVFRGLCGL